MTISNEQLVEALAEKSLSEIVELTKLLETKFGVSASSLIVQGQAAGESKPVEEEKTEFDVVLSGTKEGAEKMSIIRIVRAELDKPAGLKEVKDMVESPPVVIKSQVSKDKAEELKAKLLAVGALVELK